MKMQKINRTFHGFLGCFLVVALCCGARGNAENLSSVHFSEVQRNASSCRPASPARLLEQPARMPGVPEQLLAHTGYTLSFNRIHNQPNWVAWELTARETEGSTIRAREFRPDPLVALPHRVTTDDYKGSGYDRGHMVPAADMKWSARAMADCFYMSNICPQHPVLNGGAWAALEKACRRWTKQEGRVYIVCGPVFKGGRHKQIGRKLRITVPDGFFKVVLSVRKGHEKAIGFYYRNNGSKQPMPDAVLTVDEVEVLTGINFFPALPNALERKVESQASLKAWQ